MDEHLRNQWQTINNRFPKRLCFRVGIEAGFFSEYNNMILAMLYCLDHQIQFALDTAPCNFHPRGWEGFFIPFCESFTSSKKHFRPYDWRFSLKLSLRERTLKYTRCLWPYITCWKRELLTQDVFAKARDRALLRKQYHHPALGIDGDIQQACSQLIKLTWHYNAETQKRVDAQIQGLSLPADYVGMHIRGGDKFIEHELESIDKYFALVKQSITTRNLFILTDDYRIIQDIKAQYPEWTVYTLCAKEARGYFHEAFSQESETQKQEQLIKLFASIDILSQARQFIGTYSSNPGMYIGMRNPSICTGVDFKHWLIW